LLTIIKPGILDTLQDAGRFGFAASGINTNGVMDSYAMQVANALAGNEPGEALIEMHFPAATIRFEAGALIALSGADFDAVIDDISVPVNKTVLVAQGAILSFKKNISGCRVYLAVNGGFAVKPWLGSISTNLIAVAGGINGCKLMKDLAIPFNKKSSRIIEKVKVLPWKADTASAYMDSHYYYFIKGPEWDWLTPLSQHHMLQEPFTITPQSDRMAIRLQGEKLTCVTNQELVSAAVTMGTMQLLPSGDVLVLMADHQTTGGYPRVGTIISAHLPKMAQAVAGDYVHLLHVEQHMAEALLFAQKDELKLLQEACKFKLQLF
jgi:antagonist of KipI